MVYVRMSHGILGLRRFCVRFERNDNMAKRRRICKTHKTLILSDVNGNFSYSSRKIHISCFIKINRTANMRFTSLSAILFFALASTASLRGEL